MPALPAYTHGKRNPTKPPPISRGRDLFGIDWAANLKTHTEICALIIRTLCI